MPAQSAREAQAPVLPAVALKRDRSMERTATALVTSTSISGLLGLVFWATASHLFKPATVGLASAEISAMVLLGGLATLNLGSVFPRFLPASGSRTRVVVARGYAASLSLASVLALSFVLLRFGEGFLGKTASARAGFVVAVTFWTLFTIQDSALTGLHGAVWVPLENISFSILKIAALPIVAALALGEAGIFVAWMVPAVLMSVPVNYILFARLVPRQMGASGGTHALPSRRSILAFLAGDYTGGVAQTVTNTVMPLIVVSRLGAAANAYFYTTWIVVLAYDQVLSNIATSFIVESAARPGETRAFANRMLRFGAFVLIPLSLLLVVGASPLLHLLGREYAVHATTLLRLIGAAMLVRFVVIIYLAHARLARRIRRIIAVQVANAAGVLTLGSVLLGSRNIAGVGLGYLLTQATLAAFTIVPVVGHLRSRTGTSPQAAHQ
jgi:O-antigen/teichoic acid export membrane protein